MPDFPFMPCKGRSGFICPIKGRPCCRGIDGPRLRDTSRCRGACGECFSYYDLLAGRDDGRTPHAS